MELHAHTVVSSLIERYPLTEEVFAWHGVALDDEARAMSLYALCWVKGLELQELIAELDDVLDETDDPTEETWTDEVPTSWDDDDDDDDSDFFAVEAPDLKHTAD